MECKACNEHTEEVNTEPKRIVMLVVWYEYGKPYIGREPDLWDFWQSLPKDGLQAIRGYYNHRNPSNNAPLGFTLSGCDWYFMTMNGIVGGDTNTTKKEIEDRYFGASVKRGRWTTPANIDRINEEIGSWR